MSTSRWLNIYRIHKAFNELEEEDQDALFQEIEIERLVRRMKHEQEGPWISVIKDPKTAEVDRKIYKKPMEGLSKDRSCHD